MTKRKANQPVTGKQTHSPVLSLAKDSSSVPEDVHRLQVTVLHTLQDRWEGTSMTFEVWGAKPSAQFITAALLDADVRERVASFFVRREFGGMFQRMVQLKTMKPNETILTKHQVFNAVMACDGMSVAAGGVIVELILPTLIQLRMVSDNIKYSRHVRYDFKRVTVEDIKNDVAMFSILEAVSKVKVSSIDANQKHSVASLAEVLAEAMRPIGLTILDITNLSSIVDDIVKGIRAFLDPIGLAGGLEGSVSPEWRTHSVVQELAQNLTFVRSALALPPGSSITPVSEGWKLEKWAPMVVAAIKSSARYSWVGKAEALRHYSLEKIRDGKGKVQSVVLTRSVKTQAVAQSVFAVDDDFMPGAYNISATRDRIADAVQSAYGKADFSTLQGARVVVGALTDAIEAGWTGNKAVYVVDAAGSGTDASDVAVMLSSRMYVEIGDEGVRVDEISAAYREAVGEEDEDWERVWSPMWWYVVPTRELNLDVWSGSHNGSEIITSDPAEVLLAVDAFDAKDALPARPQVLGPAAFATRVIDFDSGLLQEVNSKFRFDIEVNDVKMCGSLRAIDFASLRSSKHVALVKPHFNNEVIRGVQEAFVRAQDLITQMRSSEKEADQWLTGSNPGAAFFEFAARRAAREMLYLAQQLSPAFRQEVHDAIVERTLAARGVSVDEAVVMRARLRQKTFAACADVLALQFFLHLQGFEIGRAHV